MEAVLMGGPWFPSRASEGWDVRHPRPGPQLPPASEAEQELPSEPGDPTEAMLNTCFQLCLPPSGRSPLTHCCPLWRLTPAPALLPPLPFCSALERPPQPICPLANLCNEPLLGAALITVIITPVTKQLPFTEHFLCVVPEAPAILSLC